MNLIGVIKSKSTGLWVDIPVLKSEYGPLSFIGEATTYNVGDRVLLVDVGADEYVVVGVLHP